VAVPARRENFPTELGPPSRTTTPDTSVPPDTTFYANGILVGDNAAPVHARGRSGHRGLRLIQRLPRKWQVDYDNDLRTR
jgi:hypothetical protein